MVPYQLTMISVHLCIDEYNPINSVFNKFTNYNYSKMKISRTKQMVGK